MRGTAEVQIMTACFPFIASSNSGVTPLVISATYSLSGASKLFSVSRLCIQTKCGFVSRET